MSRTLSKCWVVFFRVSFSFSGSSHGLGRGRMVRVSCLGLVLLCSLRMMDGAPGFWAMVNGNRFVGLLPFNNTLWLFFYEPWSIFLWDFRVLFSQVNLLANSNCYFPVIMINDECLM